MVFDGSILICSDSDRQQPSGCVAHPQNRCQGQDRRVGTIPGWIQWNKYQNSIFVV